jgi:hypothetical protein
MEPAFTPSSLCDFETSVLLSTIFAALVLVGCLLHCPMLSDNDSLGSLCLHCLGQDSDL